MALRDQVNKLFRRPPPEVREGLNKAARTEDQVTADDEKSLQLKELKAAQTDRAEADRQASRFEAGSQHSAPRFIPPGESATPPLRPQELEAQTDKAVAAKHNHERQMIEAKSVPVLVQEAKARQAPPQKDDDRKHQLTEESQRRVEQQQNPEAFARREAARTASAEASPASVLTDAEKEALRDVAKRGDIVETAEAILQPSEASRYSIEEREARIAARTAEIEAEQAGRAQDSSHDLDPGRTMGG